MHVIGTAGHVDHGKSALVQRLTGIDPDRFEEEKRRGLTIDLGFAWLPLPSGREIGIVDVPGHERFIKNMLAGAGGISICLFVVAATEGWMPQSAEHLTVLDVLGVRTGVVAVTKADLVDDETLELAVAEIEDKLAPSSLAGSAIVPCSSITGSGIDDVVAALDEAVAGAPPAADAERPRLWIDRVFTIAGAGTVATGTLAGGAFAAGDEVEIAPEGRRARIRSIQSHKKDVERIGPGNRTALNLAGLERQGARRGDAIVKAGRWRNTDRVDALIRVLPAEITGHDYALTEKGAHLLYVGSAETPVRVKLLGDESIAVGSVGLAQLYLRDALPLGPRDRFVLREAGRVLTYGGGEVLDPGPPVAHRGDAARIALLKRLAAADAAGALTALVEHYGAIDLAEATFRSGATGTAPLVVPVGRMLMSRTAFDELVDEAHDLLTRHHAAHPLERGMQREVLRSEIGADPATFEALLDAMDDVSQEGAVLRLASFGVRLTADQVHRRDRLVAAIESSGYTPPLAKELDADPALLRALVDSGELVPIGDFFLTNEQARRARSIVRSAIDSTGPKTVAEIRDLLGTSRKYAVPLCEWLDATGATRRQGDVRVLGTAP